MAWLTLKRGLIIAVVLVLIPVAWAAWWLGSPLFIDKTVEEEFPLAFSAVVPEGMKRSEVEKVMETMAKVDSPREEPMGEVMAVTVALKKGEFRGWDTVVKVQRLYTCSPTTHTSCDSSPSRRATGRTFTSS